ncbi:hypothetical protein B0T17DRAFT_120186 [Bombardia bombarda]|uniref:C2H2-type domain-containing protein n=1 Tax=Bombardia bombarda TaxID=252184 RepID=A0AA39U431_9PEZI|nr:hypothetical protein B0T17DRAFT_120186 [Bombardia bombarda]
MESAHIEGTVQPYTFDQRNSNPENSHFSFNNNPFSMNGSYSNMDTVTTDLNQFTPSDISFTPDFDTPFPPDSHANATPPLVNPLDPSSDVDGQGNTKSGYRWCCNKWWKFRRDFNHHYSKHVKNHTLPEVCIADHRCSKRYPHPKELRKHYWSRHKDYARDPKNNVPDISGKCSNCGKRFSRKDNITPGRHRCRSARQLRTLSSSN